MKILTRIGKVLIITLCIIAFNMLMDVFVFNTEMTPKNIGSAIFIGTLSGATFGSLLTRPSKNKVAKNIV